MPDTTAIEAASADLSLKIFSLVVTTQDEYLYACDEFKRIKLAQKAVVALFREPKQKAAAAHKSICAAENKLLEPLERLESTHNQKIVKFQQEQRRLQAIEADRLRKEADEIARLESERLKKIQDDERMRQAEQLQQAGFKQEAEACIAMDLPAPVVAPVIQKVAAEIPKVAGLGVRTNWRAEITQPLLLLKEILEGRQFFNIIFKASPDGTTWELNDKGLNDLAKALKNELNIPGVRVVSEEKAQFRS